LCWISSAFSCCAAMGRTLSNSSVAPRAAIVARAALRCSSENSCASEGSDSAAKPITAPMATRRARFAKVIFDPTPCPRFKSVLPVYHPDATFAGDDREACQSDEQAMLHDSRDHVQFVCECFCSRNTAKRCVDNEMPTVRNKRLAILHAQADLAGEAKLAASVLDRQNRGLETKGIDLDG